MNTNLLNIIADNPELFRQLRVLLENHFVDIAYDPSASDELVGQQTRARLEGRRRLREAFIEIEKCRSRGETETRPNPAR